MFSDLVKDWLMLKKQPAEETTFHVEFSVAEDGSVHEFKADGKGVDVLRAMEEFEKLAGPNPSAQRPEDGYSQTSQGCWGNNTI